MASEASLSAMRSRSTRARLRNSCRWSARCSGRDFALEGPVRPRRSAGHADPRRRRPARLPRPPRTAAVAGRGSLLPGRDHRRGRRRARRRRAYWPRSPGSRKSTRLTSPRSPTIRSRREQAGSWADPFFRRNRTASERAPAGERRQGVLLEAAAANQSAYEGPSDIVTGTRGRGQRSDSSREPRDRMTGRPLRQASAGLSPQARGDGARLPQA